MYQKCTRKVKEMKVRSLLLPRSGNCLMGFQAEPGRLPFLESILEGGEKWERSS